MFASTPTPAQMERLASARLAPPRRLLLDGSFSTDFTCRKRAMHNLTSEQARLAHGGRVGARLRRNSPVYYWQTTAQRRSRHEALCDKRSRWHLTTFGSHGKFEEKARAKCASVGKLKHPNPNPNPSPNPNPGARHLRERGRRRQVRMVHGQPQAGRQAQLRGRLILLALVDRPLSLLARSNQSIIAVSAPPPPRPLARPARPRLEVTTAPPLLPRTRC